jgi:hypothetical protein
MMRWIWVFSLLCAAAVACGDPDECFGRYDCEPTGATVPAATSTALDSVDCIVSEPGETCPTRAPGTPVPSPTVFTPQPVKSSTPAPPSPTPQPSVAGESGIAGVVLIGPQCPVVREGEECPDAPYAARIEVFDAAGGLAAEVASGDDGLFRVSVPAGEYRLVARPLTDTSIPGAVEQTVVVSEGAITGIVVSMDSGIR